MPPSVVPNAPSPGSFPPGFGWLSRWGYHPNRVIAALLLAPIARPGHLGYPGRRALVSRKWPGKTLKDHRGDRKTGLIATPCVEPQDPAHYTWQNACERYTAVSE